MQTTSGPFHPTRFRDLAVTVEFHCNSACRFCVVQEGMNRFKGVPFDKFAAMVDENRVSRKYDRVLFTGGEVTIENGLFEFVDYARKSGTFDYLRVQTNGRKLADRAFATRLVAAGINEFFVSIHGDSATVHDDITQRPGSFDELIAGLENLATMNVAVLTNTVINRRNLASLPGIVDIVHPRGVRRMDFWNYLPMEDHADDRNLIAPLGELMPPLVAALDRCRELGIDAVTKYVPRCLLGDHGATLDNGQPDVVIVESFWDEFPKFNCLYEAVCEHGDTCLGVSHDYVNKFGWEENVLRPAPRTSPWVERRNEVVEGKTDRPGTAAEPAASSPADGHPAWAALVAAVPEGTPGHLRGLQLTRNQARYRYELESGASVEVVLSARDDAAPALARTQSFNVFYVNADVRGQDRALSALLRALVDSVTARDNGSLTLDPRKGLARDAVRLHALRRPAS